jgi:NAD(P)-dependent dehydrogenase (short-subunit alcohol dehydrogenase family)
VASAAGGASCASSLPVRTAERIVEVTLRGKTAIVTGAASGIGLATVLKYLEADAAGVVAVDVAPELPEPLARHAAGGDRLRYVRGDVGVEQTAVEFTRAALDAWGRIDVLVNNAGISVVKAIHSHTPQEWDAVMNTNVKALYWSARHVIPVMMRQRSGVVLNTGSISGVAGIATQGAYGPSKGAVHQLTRQMAIEYAPHGIRVNAVCCGTVDTPIVHRSAAASGDPERYWAMLQENHPIGRIASADEVAAFFTYMASDLASFFTGATLMMDGGFSAR